MRLRELQYREPSEAEILRIKEILSSNVKIPLVQFVLFIVGCLIDINLFFRAQLNILVYILIAVVTLILYTPLILLWIKNFIIHSSIIKGKFYVLKAACIKRGKEKKNVHKNAANVIKTEDGITLKTKGVYTIGIALQENTVFYIVKAMWVYTFFAG